MGVKMQVVQTNLVDLDQATNTVEKVEVNRKAGNPTEFREEAIAVIQEALDLTYFEVCSEAITECGADKVVAKSIA